MRLLFISIWSLDNGLTQSTVLPVIRFLRSNQLVDQIILATPETKGKLDELEEHEEFTHLPISGLFHQNFSSGLNVLISMSVGLFKYALKHPKFVDRIWCRGSVAGGAGYLMSKILRIPFGVESFEPHSEYMIESGAWKRNGAKFRLQKFIERKIIQNATTVITVSKSYALQVQSKRAEENTHCIPCSVFFDEYSVPAKNQRSLESPVNGIYVGKFGDIYYSEEFFDLVELLMNSYPNYRQTILTPMMDHANEQLAKRNISKGRYEVKLVLQADVKNYLKTADIAFCPVKQSPIRKYCSPVKTAEYLAAGLPILISRDISDDSDFISKNKIGLVIDFELKPKPFDLLAVVNEKTPQQIHDIGRNYRDASINFLVYQKCFRQ